MVYTVMILIVHLLLIIKIIKDSEHMYIKINLLRKL